MTKFRVYDPSIGRWWQVDPKTDSLVNYSPYNYSFNNPIRYNDPMGDCPPNNPNCGGNKSVLKAALQSNVSSAARATTNSAGSIVSGKVGVQIAGIGAKFKVSGVVEIEAQGKVGSGEVGMSNQGPTAQVSVAQTEFGLGLGPLSGQASSTNATYSTEKGGSLMDQSAGAKIGSTQYGALSNEVSIGGTLGNLSAEVSANLDAVKDTIANGVETVKQFFKNLLPNPVAGE